MRRTAHLLAGIVLLGGCNSEQIPTETTAHIQPRPEAIQASASAVNQDLAALRRVTATFHNFQTAVAAGWSAQITPCMTDPAADLGARAALKALRHYASAME